MVELHRLMLSTFPMMEYLDSENFDDIVAVVAVQQSLKLEKLSLNVVFEVVSVRNLSMKEQRICPLVLNDVVLV